MQNLVSVMSAFPFDLSRSMTPAGPAHATPEGLPPSLAASGPSLTVEAPTDNRVRDKAYIRAVRQRQIEEEQRREEESALHMTDEEREILERCFASVKTVFADLDGLSWSTQPPGISPGPGPGPGLGLGLGIRRPAPPDENSSTYPSSPWHASKRPPHFLPRSQSYDTLPVPRPTPATVRAPHKQRTSLSPIQMCASPTVTQTSYLAACALRRRESHAVMRPPSW